MKGLRIWAIMALALSMGACSINKDLLYKTPSSYEYDIPPDTMDVEYRIQPYDQIDFKLYSNDGFLLIDLSSGSVNQGNNNRISSVQSKIRYRVDVDGRAKLPTLGYTYLQGMTVREAELHLQELYAAFYVDPFIMIEITNNRVIVMPGGGGEAKVITLTNNNTTVLEAIAMAGGVAQRGNASKVKLIRKSNEGRSIYHLDLSKIDGVPEGDILVQANDIIYVEPTPQIAAEALRDLTPIVALITSMIVLINIVR